MSRYEEAYGTDWTTLDPTEAIERAYALGVAASLGEHDPDELAALRAEMDSAYNRSVVELAYDEGRTEARSAAPEADEDAAVWATLVDGDRVSVDPDDVPTGGKQGLPKAIDKLDALDRPSMDRNRAVDRPEFLEKD